MPHDLYVSWAALYEGAVDEAYLELLLPRAMEEIIMSRGKRNTTIHPSRAIRLHRGSVEAVAKEACAARDAFHIVFIHADTGGRAIENRLERRSIRYCETMQILCNWPPVRCIAVTPRHESEAWMLADARAVAEALGYLGPPSSLGLPADAQQAEQIGDPKAVLAAAMTQVRGRRRRIDVGQLVPAVAQRQSLALLRQSRSYVAFEASLVAALADIGAI
jgi:hypothetical protein